MKTTIENNVDELPIKIDWIEGNRLGVTVKHIKVNASITMDKSISFTKKLIFWTKNGKYYPIMISGTIDNSLCTI